MCKWVPIAFIGFFMSVIVVVPIGCGIFQLREVNARVSSLLLILGGLLVLGAMVLFLYRPTSRIEQLVAVLAATIAGSALAYGFSRSPSKFVLPWWLPLIVYFFLAVCVYFVAKCL